MFEIIEMLLNMEIQSKVSITGKTNLILAKELSKYFQTAFYQLLHRTPFAYKKGKTRVMKKENTRRLNNPKVYRMKQNNKRISVPLYIF
jgi:hypothetical protein